MDYLIEFYKKALLIYQPNKEHITINDIHRGIATLYTVKDRYDLAKQYIEENNVTNAEDILAQCDLELGNYQEALENISGNFLKAVSFRSCWR